MPFRTENSMNLVQRAPVGTPRRPASAWNVPATNIKHQCGPQMRRTGHPLPASQNLTALTTISTSSNEPESIPTPLGEVVPSTGPPLPHTTAPRYLSIVTGASRGLGAAIARTLALNGPPLYPAGDGSGSLGSLATGPSTSPWTHDLVLLASDPTRLNQFVQRELVGLVGTPGQQRPRHGQQKPPDHPLTSLRLPEPDSANEQNLVQPDASENPCGGDAGHQFIAAASTNGSALARSSATATTTTTNNNNNNNININININIKNINTRVRTVSFDLGNLDALEANTARLLAAAAPGASGACESQDGAAPGSTASPPDPRAAPGSAGPAGLESSTATGVLTIGDGGLGAAGVLPLSPGAYTHVLLVHNAGQVGDLVPIEQQSLANMRRQTDLNVTSFAHLTAAVLRTFLHAPLVDPPPCDALQHPHVPPPPTSTGPLAHEPQQELGSAVVGATAACAGDAKHSLVRPGVNVSHDNAVPLGASLQHQHQQPLPSPPARRVVTIVNISSVSVDQPYEHFSLYGMGKAARNMIMRSVAHEADLREAESQAAVPVVAATALSETASMPARVRVLSYAPGAIDTEMQAAAREALPPGQLKARFEDNAASGRLVDPRVSAQVLYDTLTTDSYANGAHLNYYAAAAPHGGGDAATDHPLARRS